MVVADLMIRPTQLEDGFGRGGSSRTFKSKSVSIYLVLLFICTLSSFMRSASASFTPTRTRVTLSAVSHLTHLATTEQRMLLSTPAINYLDVHSTLY